MQLIKIYWEVVRVVNNGDSKLYLEWLYNLILNSETSEKERKLLIQSKNDIESGKDLKKVMYNLKQSLLPLAIEQSLTNDVLNLYSDLLKNFSLPKKWSYLNNRS